MLLVVASVHVAVAIQQTGVAPLTPRSRVAGARGLSLKVLRLQHVHGRGGAAERSEEQSEGAGQAECWHADADAQIRQVRSDIHVAEVEHSHHIPASHMASARGHKRPIGLAGLMAAHEKLQKGMEGVPVNHFDDPLEHQMTAPPLAPQLGPGGPACCKRPNCHFNEIVFDHHQSYYVCKCGTVQSQRPLPSYEAEHRSFADEENSDRKKRTERADRDGKSGGTGVAPSLQRAARLADSGEKSEMPREWALREDKYVDAVRSLAYTVTSMQAYVESAVHSARQLVQAMMDHNKQCTRPKCRLCVKPHTNLVGAALLLFASRRQHNASALFQDMATYLKAVGVEKDQQRQVGKASSKVRDLLKGYVAKEGYVCGARSAASGAPAASGPAASEEDIDGLLDQYAALLPRILEGLGELSRRVEWSVQRRATEVLKQWLGHGLKRAAQPHTVAAAALWKAKEALVNESGSAELEKIELAAVAKAAGLKSADAIRQFLAAHAE